MNCDECFRVGAKHPNCRYVDGVTHCYKFRIYITKVMVMDDFKVMEHLCEEMCAAMAAKHDILDTLNERVHAQPYGLAICDPTLSPLIVFEHQHALKTRRWQYEVVHYRKWWRRFDITCDCMLTHHMHRIDCACRPSR